MSEDVGGDGNSEDCRETEQDNLPEGKRGEETLKGSRDGREEAHVDDVERVEVGLELCNESAVEQEAVGEVLSSTRMSVRRDPAPKIMSQVPRSCDWSERHAHSVGCLSPGWCHW